jgi:hypothetical protein
VVTVAGGRFAPGHLGELTRIVPFEMVDAALAETRAVQQRLRCLPSRVVVYLLLAAGLFEELGYGQVWARMCAGLTGLAVASPCASALAGARRRIGVAPLRALFDLLRGPAAGLTRTGVYWRGRLVCAIDGTMMCCPDTAANLTVYRRGGGNHGGTGYPMLRLLGLVACGTRTVITATFGTDQVGETGYVPDLLGAMRTGMIVLADRNFGYAPTVAAVAGTGADLLFRIKAGRRMPVCRRLPDGSWISRMGRILVRVIRAEITITTSAGSRTEVYQLVTTLTDPDPVTGSPAAEIITLYHERWEIETAFFELKSTILGGRVLRARTPAGVAQEVYALLVTYQALRIAISDATLARPDLDPDRGSFTIALNAARDQLATAAGVIAGTVVDLVGEIGRQVRDHLMPARRVRTNPRVVKRAISKYVASSKNGRHRGPSRKSTITINTVPAPRP